MGAVIISDVHQEWRKAAAIANRYPTEHKVWLGDWFDSYTHTPEAAWDTKKLLIDLMADETNEFVLGNHDAHYIWTEVEGIHSPGYKRDTRVLLLDMNWVKFQISIYCEGFLLSHAGWRWIPEQIVGHENLIMAYIEDCWAYARGRLGELRLPTLLAWDGPLWLRWEDFKPTPGVSQIVGHTLRKHVRMKGSNICLDTGLKHIALIDKGLCAIEAV